MDQHVFSPALYKWDSRAAAVAPAPHPPQNRFFEAMAPPPPPSTLPPPFCPRTGDQIGVVVLADFFQPYGIRYPIVAKLAELGLTLRTLLDMRDDELDEMMVSLSQIYRCDLLVGEKYGIKAAVRAERRRHQGLFDNSANPLALDALSQEGLSEEPMQLQEKEAAGSGGGATWELVNNTTQKKKMKKNVRRKKKKTASGSGENEEEDDDEVDKGGRTQRQREHPFIVTEPGEVARGKKNGLDYLFHLYDQCREFLVQVQNIAKERGEKCPTKVTNQVYRYATAAGATYINKPKIRFYVHCYALHCLDEKTSNVLRKTYKGENVTQWREACYEPLVTFASRNGWDIDAIFNADPRLSVWYVPPKVRKLCHAQRSNVVSAANLNSF